MRTDREFSEKLLERALRSGASLAEVYQRAASTVSAAAKGGEAEAVETSSTMGYSLRVINEGRLGFSYSTDRSQPEMVVEAALKTAALTERDEFLDLPEPMRPAAPEVFDPAIEGVSEEEAVLSACLIERGSLEEDKRIKKIREAGASFAVKDTLVLNSRGISYGYASTSCSAHIMAVAEDSGEGRTGWDFQAGRFMSDVPFKEVGVKAARRALKMLGARRISPTRAPLLLESLVAAEFLSVFASMLSSEAVQKGKSLMRGRLGQKVVSDLMDVTDDGLLERGPGTRHIDDEGVPVRRTELIKGGVLKGFMYNTHTARKDNVNSTGNAVRGGASSLPSVGPMNLYISPAKGAIPSGPLLGDMDRGLYVMEVMGIHTANPVSGDFSVGVAGLWVERGEVRYPVKEAVISGNLLNFFGNLQAVGSDLRFYGAIGSPSILVGPTEISA